MNIPRSVVLIIITLIFVGKESMSQEYTEFYLEDAEWHINYPTYGANSSMLNTIYRYVTHNDTIINGATYRNLYAQNLCNYWIYSDGTKDITSVTDTIVFLVGALREEGKKVYFYHYRDLNISFPGPWAYGHLDFLEENTLYLLYDFNAVEGDTVFHGGGTYTIIGEELDAHLGHRRHKATLSDMWPYPDAILVEGIGSSRGLFSPFKWYDEYLDCFRNLGEELLYPFCDQCPEPTINVNVKPVRKNLVPLIYPNPVTDELYIEIGDASLKKIQICSTLGRIIREENLENKEPKILVSDLPTGEYFLKIESVDGDVVNLKFIKQ